MGNGVKWQSYDPELELGGGQGGLPGGSGVSAVPWRESRSHPIAGERKPPEAERTAPIKGLRGELFSPFQGQRESQQQPGGGGLGGEQEVGRGSFCLRSEINGDFFFL